MEFITHRAELGGEPLVFRGESTEALAEWSMARGKEQPNEQGGNNGGGRGGENKHIASCIARLDESIPDEQFAISAWEDGRSGCRIERNEPTEM